MTQPTDQTSAADRGASLDQPCIAARDAFPDRKGDWMQTFTGRRFWPLDPRSEDVRIEDIAHALAMQARYGGHCERYYSVAEHSVHLARAAPPELALWLLLHDGSEAYLSDMIRPLKRHMPEYRAAEDRVAWAVYEAFGLDPGMEPAEVKVLDNRILMDERAQAMRPTADEWNYGGATEPLGVTLQFWLPVEAERQFLATFAAITGQTVSAALAAAPSRDGKEQGALSESQVDFTAYLANLLERFRDFVIRYAKVWDISDGPCNHHNPIWVEIAEALKNYSQQSSPAPRPGAFAAGTEDLRKAAQELLDACVEDMGYGEEDGPWHDEDDSPVGGGEDGPLAVQFGHLRRLRDALAAAPRFPAPETGGTTQAVRDVLAERRRQVEVEGWSPEHDDTHRAGEMATAGACYAYMAGADDAGRRRIIAEGVPYRWPWEASWWKPTERRRDLVKAAALILAEIERLDRKALPTPLAQGDAR